MAKHLTVTTATTRATTTADKKKIVATTSNQPVKQRHSSSRRQFAVCCRLSSHRVSTFHFFHYLFSVLFVFAFVQRLLTALPRRDGPHIYQRLRQRQPIFFICSQELTRRHEKYVKEARQKMQNKTK